MKKYLIKLANHLDKKGFHKEADYVDWILKSAEPRPRVTETEFTIQKHYPMLYMALSPYKYEIFTKITNARKRVKAQKNYLIGEFPDRENQINERMIPDDWLYGKNKTRTKFLNHAIEGIQFFGGKAGLCRVILWTMLNLSMKFINMVDLPLRQERFVIMQRKSQKE